MPQASKKRRRWPVIAAGVAICGAVSAGGGFAAEKEPADGSVTIKNIPHIKQLPDFCGEACGAMALAWRGVKVSQQQVFAATGVDPLLGRGAFTPELKRGLERLGYDVGGVWYRAPAARPQAELQRQLDAMLKDLRAQIPSIVCMHYDETPDSTEHFRLIVGYDAKRQQLLYHEPAEADGAYRRMDVARFLQLWPLKYDAAQWTLVRLRLQPQRLKAPTAVAGWSPAQVAQHVMALKQRLPRGFHVVWEPPFMVIGDEEPATVQHRATHTVRWATTLLKQAYFKRDPDHIIDIWLFKDAASYNNHVPAVFGRAPSTPFGYYDEDARALIMNIETGGGTLVHEIVHPFVAANFPTAPPWLNEGLGSLYEQCHERGGKIRGLTNWRLPGLQDAIREGLVPSFRELTQADEAAFYGADPGTNYGQSRYLCYYLQERGLLDELYHRMHKNARSDPTGYRTLKQLLGVKDMRAFQREWEQWVLELRFPPST